MARILVTNDDGIHSRGIIELAEALRALGEVTVIAPALEMSAASHSLTLNRPLRIDHVDEYRYAVDGTPTDCVTLGLMKILSDRTPDLVVSGINKGGNLGDDVSYSGTVAGALEGTIYGVPSMAISLVTRKDFHFRHAADFAVSAARKVLEEGLPDGVFLNINVPLGPIRGAAVTRQGRKAARTTIIEGVDPRHRQYYWIGEDSSGWVLDEGTDYEAVHRGLVSITPLRNDLTDYGALDRIHTWNSSSEFPS